MQLSPAKYFIGVTWELNDQSGDCDEYRISYSRLDGGFTSNCYTTGPSPLVSTSCFILLFHCTGYNITVQPLNHRTEIGVPATDLSYTLPGEDSDEFILSLFDYNDFKIYATNELCK